MNAQVSPSVIRRADLDRMVTALIDKVRSGNDDAVSAMELLLQLTDRGLVAWDLCPPPPPQAAGG